MAKDIENFRDELKKLAKAIEILETSFIKNSDFEVKVKLEQKTFDELMTNLNNNSNDKQCIISLGNCNFTFSKM